MWKNYSRVSGPTEACGARMGIYQEPNEAVGDYLDRVKAAYPSHYGKQLPLLHFLSKLKLDSVRYLLRNPHG